MTSTWLVVDVELEVGDVDISTVLVEIDHVGVHPRQVEHKLREPHQGQLYRQLWKGNASNNVFFLLVQLVTSAFNQ